jgi:glycerophosphoryl diester phosphodiesterase
MTAGEVQLPTLIAHRGNAAEFPENTLEALQSAVDLGIRHVEFDVQMTSDKVPVVIHDADLARVGDSSECVHELTWSQLGKMPVGEFQRFGRRFSFTYPPSLQQVVHAMAGWPDVTAYVEIKRASIRKFGREILLKRVIETIRPVLDRCVVISFDLPSLRILRPMCGARIGWVLPDYTDEARHEAEMARPELLFCNLERLPADGSALWPGPWQWAIYEVRDLRTARELLARGAQFAETMTVRGMLALYKEAHRQW